MILALVFITTFSSLSQYCTQGLVSQFDKKLLDAYPRTPGLCTATCIGNLLSLIDDRLELKGAKNVLKVIELIKKSSESLEKYNPNKEGVSFNQTVKTLSELAKRKNSKIKKIKAKTYAALSSEDRKMLRQESKWVDFSNQKTQPHDIKKSDRSWMILGLAGWLGRNQYTHYSHDVLALWDDSQKQLILIDPATPHDPSRWEFIPGTVDYPARLRRVSGPFYRGFAVVGVEEWIKILTQT